MAFPAISFKSTLRPSQLEVVSVAETHLAQAERKLYINAPPGSGKTVTGLYLWAQMFTFSYTHMTLPTIYSV